jgi:hypothetical protein
VWNGEEDMRLFLRALAPDGAVLRIDSPELDSTAEGGRSAYYERAMAFQYVFHIAKPIPGYERPVVFPYRLALTVSGAGAVLGKESLTLVKRTGSYRAREF